MVQRRADGLWRPLLSEGSGGPQWNHVATERSAALGHLERSLMPARNLFLPAWATAGMSHSKLPVPPGEAEFADRISLRRFWSAVIPGLGFRTAAACYLLQHHQINASVQYIADNECQALRRQIILKWCLH